jgi:hypothetical protein
MYTGLEIRVRVKTGKLVKKKKEKEELEVLVKEEGDGPSSWPPWPTPYRVDIEKMMRRKEPDGMESKK